MNQAVNPVLARKAWNQAFLMLTDSPFQAVRHSRVQVPRPAGKDVDVVGSVSGHMQIPHPAGKRGAGRHGEQGFAVSGFMQIPHRHGGPGFGMTVRATSSVFRTLRAVSRVMAILQSDFNTSPFILPQFNNTVFFQATQDIMESLAV